MMDQYLFIPLLMLFAGWQTSLAYVIQVPSETSIIQQKVEYVQSMPGLLSFWSFQEPAGTARAAAGRFQYSLQEDGGPISRYPEGVFGRYSAKLTPGKRFVVRRANCPGLDLHGHHDLTVVAWIKREPWCETPNYTRWDPINPCCEFVAGVFNESSKHRQYGLFLNLHSFNSSDQVCGLISDNGGDTPGRNGCVTGSFGKTKIQYSQWYCIGMTYDNLWVKSYVNGRLDTRKDRNPFQYPNGIFNGGVDGADFTVGSNSAFGKKHNYLRGLFGGVAVFDRALADQEMAALCSHTAGTHSHIQH